jgi:hypothetical protein
MALAAQPALPGSDAPSPIERLRLTCTGAMIAEGQPLPGSRIMADGLIDFVGRRVQGFGVGSQPIIVLTASDIDFGSSPQGEGARGNIVEGSIKRQTGATRIVVRSPQDSSSVLIELTLACEFERPVS